MLTGMSYRVTKGFKEITDRSRSGPIREQRQPNDGDRYDQFSPYPRLPHKQ
jgi:hypothetical protein